MKAEKRYKTTIEEIMRVRGFSLRQGELKMVDAGLDIDLSSPLGRYTTFKIPAGKISIDKWIFDNGFKKCLRREATAVLTVGEKSEVGLWITGKYKNYWLTTEAV